MRRGAQREVKIQNNINSSVLPIEARYVLGKTKRFGGGKELADTSQEVKAVGRKLR